MDRRMADYLRKGKEVCIHLDPVAVAIEGKLGQEGYDRMHAASAEQQYDNDRPMLAIYAELGITADEANALRQVMKDRTCSQSDMLDKIIEKIERGEFVVEAA